MIPEVFTAEGYSIRIPRESGDDPHGRDGADNRADVFPARAGMILVFTSLGNHLLGIPRESGDDPLPGYWVRISHPYSPRERG